MLRFFRRVASDSAITLATIAAGEAVHKTVKTAAGLLTMPVGPTESSPPRIPSPDANLRPY